jgi:hypothetical protein
MQELSFRPFFIQVDGLPAKKSPQNVGDKRMLPKQLICLLHISAVRFCQVFATAFFEKKPVTCISAGNGLSHGLKIDKTKVRQ